MKINSNNNFKVPTTVLMACHADILFLNTVRRSGEREINPLIKFRDLVGIRTQSLLNYGIHESKNPYLHQVDHRNENQIVISTMKVLGCDDKAMAVF